MGGKGKCAPKRQIEREREGDRETKTEREREGEGEGESTWGYILRRKMYV